MKIKRRRQRNLSAPFAFTPCLASGAARGRGAGEVSLVVRVGSHGCAAPLGDRVVVLHQTGRLEYLECPEGLEDVVDAERRMHLRLDEFVQIRDDGRAQPGDVAEPLHQFDEHLPCRVAQAALEDDDERLPAIRLVVEEGVHRPSCRTDRLGESVDLDHVHRLHFVDHVRLEDELAGRDLLQRCELDRACELVRERQPAADASTKRVDRTVVALGVRTKPVAAEEREAAPRRGPRAAGSRRP